MTSTRICGLFVGTSILLIALASGCGQGAATVDTAPVAPEARTPIDKLIWADYFPHHRTRAHDGNVGSWRQCRTAEGSKATKTRFNYNPDLIDANGRHQLASGVYPLVGMQSDLDIDYQEFQILQAKVSHIDGFVVEWVLPGDHPPDILMRSLIRTARKYDFKLGVNFIEDSHFRWYKNIDKTCDTREKLMAAYQQSIQYLLDSYYSGPTALTVDGHPVIFLFSGTEPDEFKQWIASHEFKLPEGTKRPWFVRRATIGPKESHTDHAYAQWRPLVDGTFGWVAGRYRLSGKPTPDAFIRANKFDHFVDSDDTLAYQRMVTAKNQQAYDDGDFSIRINSVCPGFDNRPCAGWGKDLWYLPREHGATARKQWKHIVDNRDRIDAVMLVTWNDYTESDSLEPTVDGGLAEMEMARWYGAAFKGVKSDPAGIELPEMLFKFRKKTALFNRTGLDTAYMTERLDQAGMLISKGQYAEARKLLDRVYDSGKRMRKRVVSRKFRLSFPSQWISPVGKAENTDGVYEVTPSARLCLRFDEETASVLRSRNFEGFLDFEYLDEGTDMFKIITAPARPDVPGPPHLARLYSVAGEINRDGTGKWVKARITLLKENAGFNHKATYESDIVFAGSVKVRNIAASFEVYTVRE